MIMMIRASTLDFRCDRRTVKVGQIILELTKMGALPSRLKRASGRYLKRKGPKRLTRQQMHVVRQFLPDFQYYELSTELHRQVASSHWDTVFRHSSGHSTSTTVASRGSRSSLGSTETRLRQLYDSFYVYLDNHSPHLKHVFRASLHVRSKVLVHISGGIRFFLLSDNMNEKMTELTKTHGRFGVEREFYNPLGNALIHAMEETSEGVWSDEIEDAWRRLFTHCSAVLLVYHTQAINEKPVPLIQSLKVRSRQSTSDLSSAPQKLHITEQ